ncbi:MAG: LacI family DNA-binding transcriptional regulator [Leeuwenhoekiella sp.]
MKNSKENVGIKDVAKLAKVAVATVDRVIHNRAGVSKKTRDKVLKVAAELNYTPNIMASNLSKNKKFVFGVLLPKFSPESTYWELPLKGVERAGIELEQYSISIEQYLYDQQDNNEIRKQILKVINSDIDGLILSSKFSEETDLLIQDCHEKHRPVIFIDSNTEERDSLCNIQQPLYESGQLAGQLFNYCFHVGKVLILHLKDIMDSEAIINEKVNGLKDFFREIDSSVTTEKLLIVGFDTNQINEELDDVLNKDPDIKGIFIPNSKTDYISKYLLNRGGSKVYLIGYDHLKEDDEYLEKGIIDFLICQRPEEQGYKATMKLFEYLVLRKEVEHEIIIPLDIVTRKNYKYYYNG